MPPAVTRTLKITYGTTYVGGDSTDYLLHGPVRFDQSYQRFSIRFQVIVHNATASTFKTLCSTLETAYRTPRALVKIEMEGQTFINYDPSNNTGFLAVPSISKLGDLAADTGRSRLYDCAIECQLPADLSGQSGRLDSSITLDHDASRRRTITIQGAYTALSTNSARAQYNAAIGTYASSILSSVGSGGTFDLIREDVTPDDADKNCAFQRVYQEVLYAIASGGLSHASIRGATVVFSRRRPAPGDSPSKSVRRLEEVTIDVACNVDQSVSTSLTTLYADSIRPYLIQQAQTLYSPTATAIVDETRPSDPTGNTLRAQLVLLMVINGTGTLEYRIQTAVAEEKGELFQAVWAGSRFSKYRFDGIARRMRTTIEVERRAGLWGVAADGSSFSGSANVGGGSASAVSGGGSSQPTSSGAGRGGSTVQGITVRLAPQPVDPGAPSGGGGAPAAGGDAGGGGAGGASGYVVITTDRRATPLRLGVDYTIDVTDLQTTTVEEYYEEPGRTSSGGAITPSEPNIRGPAITPGGGVPTGMRGV